MEGSQRVENAGTPAGPAVRSGFSALVRGRQVSLEKAGAGIITAGERLTLNRGGGFALLSRGDFSVKSGGGLFLAAGRDISVDQGGGNVLVAGNNLQVHKGGGALMIAKHARVEAGRVGILLSNQAVIGEGSRVIFTTPQAVGMGAAFGLVFAVLCWLFCRRNG